MATATRKLSPATPRFSANDKGCPSASGTRIRKGQCHRYHEYETRPVTCIGDVPKSCTGPWAGRSPHPATMMAAAPRTGTSAAVPGKAVVEV